MPNFYPKTLTIFFIIILVAGTILLLTLDAGQSQEQTAPLQEPLVYIQCDAANITVKPADIVNITYSWIHSVEGTPIIETYRIINNTLVLVEARAQSFGAGHPYSGEEVGGDFRFEEGYLVYEAYYPVGPRLEIMGHADYPGNLTINLVGDTSLTCKNFTHALIIIDAGGAVHK